MLVLATSVSVIDDGKEVVLKRISSIHYPVQFQEDQEQVKPLLDSGSKVNAMSPTYAKRLGLKARNTNVGAQKIDGSAQETFGMVIADFQVEDKGGRPRFLQKTFLVADTKFEVVLKMLFLKISNANITFGEKTLMWKSYITSKALPTTEQIRIIDPKEFFIAALDTDSENFVVYVAIREWEKMLVHSERQAQIEAKAYIDA